MMIVAIVSVLKIMLRTLSKVSPLTAPSLLGTKKVTNRRTVKMRWEYTMMESTCDSVKS